MLAEILKIDAECYTVALVPSYKSTWPYNPEDQHRRFLYYIPLKNIVPKPINILFNRRVAVIF
jgi:hypothetical protein